MKRQAGWGILVVAMGVGLGGFSAEAAPRSFAAPTSPIARPSTANLADEVPNVRKEPTPSTKSDAVPSGGPNKPVFATVTRLPYPSDAELWIDRVPTAVPSIPGLRPGAIRRMQVVAFRPKGDQMTLDQAVALYSAAQILSPSPAAAMELINPPIPPAPTGGPQINEVVRVYRSMVPGQIAVIGSAQDVRTRSTLIYLVQITGNVGNPEALLQAKTVVSAYMLEERGRRSQPPIPPGSTPASAIVRLEGVAIQNLSRSIEQSASVSPRVKEIARVVLPQAAGVMHSAWETSMPLTDQAFVDFYVTQTQKLGWSGPVSRDETQPGRPTLLFQRPNNDGVVLVRAQPAASKLGKTGGAGTTIYVLVIEGSINVAALGTKP